MEAGLGEEESSLGLTLICMAELPTGFEDRYVHLMCVNVVGAGKEEEK